MTTNTKQDINNFLDLFLNDIPMMDVRASVEFNHGSFPNTVNLPLLNDQERADVGTTYKQQGKDEAVALGHRLVQGDIKAERVKLWAEFARQNPNGCLFCFRGGMRSHIVQEWLREAGVDYPLIEGGYKKVRRFLIDSLDEIVEKEKFIVISGRTGVGKTIVINSLPNSVDLEGLANHRGSSFGRKVDDQPTQINFENSLAIKLLKITQKPSCTIFVEDESSTIGKCSLPLTLFEKMKAAPVIVLEDSLENRIEAIKKEYVTDMCNSYKSVYGDESFGKFSEYLLLSLDRVKRRLGLDNHKTINLLMTEALAAQEKTNDTSLHSAWISSLLINYYDPMYDYQLSHKSDRVVFKGTKDDILQYCSSN